MPHIQWNVDETVQIVGFAMLAMAIVLMLIIGWRNGFAAFGRKRSTVITTILLSMLTAALIATACANPRAVKEQDASSLHMVVVVDVSRSVDYEDDAQGNQIDATLQKLAGIVTDTLEKLDEETKEKSSATIITFQDAIAETHVNDINRLADRLSFLPKDSLASGNGTDIAEALLRANSIVQKKDERGIILLATDGNQTTGDALEAAKVVASKGTPVYIVPMVGKGTGLIIESADLVRQVDANTPTFLRAVIDNNSDQSMHSEIGIIANDGTEEKPLTTSINVPAGRNAMLRHQLTFDGLGIQYRDLQVVPEYGQMQQSRLFTLVSRPPRIIAVGDSDWKAAFPTDVAEVIDVAPDEFSAATHLADADALVINEVEAGAFALGELTAVASRVKNDGLGFMLINGDHEGRELDEDTVIRSYMGTDIDKLLPVSPDQAEYYEDPPPRQIIFVIDVSGSMSAEHLKKVREITTDIITNQLRKKDRLDIITFTTTAKHELVNTPLDNDGKENAVKTIAPLVGKGGTSPVDALAVVGERDYSACGMFLFTDLGFSPVDSKPECFSTVIAVGHSAMPTDSPLTEYTEYIPVPLGGTATGVQLHFFEPEEQTKFFEPGEFEPVQTGIARYKYPLSIADIALPGNAITFVREGAQLMAVRRKPSLPVLAYAEREAGMVGVFTSKLTDEWISSEAGQASIQDWILYTVGYTARDRYDFEIEQGGDTIKMILSLLPVAGTIPDVSAIQGSIEFADGQTESIDFVEEPTATGVFRGQFRYTGEDAQQASLILTEGGVDELLRSQKIPFILPDNQYEATTLVAEDYSIGTKEDLLCAIAQLTNGVYDVEDGLALDVQSKQQSQGTPLWPYPITLAAIFYVGSIGLPRLERTITS